MLIFFSGMLDLFILTILLYFADVKLTYASILTIYINFMYVSMCFSSTLCKREMFAFIRWFAAVTEISRIKSPCKLVSMSCPRYDSRCKWLCLRRVCAGLSTMVPQAFYLYFFLLSKPVEGNFIHTL